MTLRITNSLTRTKEDFVPLDPAGRRVTFYNCGPTVYGAFHIGNARNFVVVDVMRRISGGDALLAYGTVFAIESALLVIALALTGGLRVDVAARGTLKASARRAAEELTPAAW